MATIDDLKARIDLHDLAEKLGLERPGSRGNYRSPQHDDKSPSLSIFNGGRAWKDHSTGEGGTCIDLVMYVEDIDDVGRAVKRLRDLYGIPPDPPQGERREKSRLEHWADEQLRKAEGAIDYLLGRGLTEKTVRRAIDARAVGFDDWCSPTKTPGEFGYHGPAVSFIVRTLNPGHVVAIDKRFVDPALNGGVKTQCQGEKAGYPWFVSLRQLQAARTVYVVESPINALSVEECGLPATAAIATRGTNNIDAIDWQFLAGKRVIICMDNDQPIEKQGNLCPGAAAAWTLHERLLMANISAHLIDQAPWDEEERGWNDINDILQAGGVDEVRRMLKHLQEWAIPGLRGDGYDKIKGRPRVYLPGHDYYQYGLYRTREDFTRYIKEVREKDGQQIHDLADLCGFRIAGLSRVTIASATSTMSGESDAQPRTVFAVAVQAPRHGDKLVRRVFEDEKLHNIDNWKRFGPVFSQSAFLRLVNILERSAGIGAREAVNFVGLAWRDGRPIVNEGPDCYFSDPDKQCPYHNLAFPSGSKVDARAVLRAYQETFHANAAAIALVWALGGHLKAFLGFWPHLTLQADKGAGKSTLIKRLERTLAFTMFSGQSLQTEFRLLTSISHTSHPVGWEEISARRQDVIDKAVSLLQECYQYTVSRRGSDMTEYLISAPVMLAGEDVPVRSLIGKLVRTDLVGRKGPLLPEDLPRFPIRQWLYFLASQDRTEIQGRYERAREHALGRSMAASSDDGARRMAGNYAALLVAWSLLCEFADLDPRTGAFIEDVLQEMNKHISETDADREPWVWIIEILLSEIAANRFTYPFKWGYVDDRECLFVRVSHITDHLAHTMALRDRWNALPVKTPRVLKRQLQQAQVLASEDIERMINGRREAHMIGLDIEALARYGLYAAPPESIDDEPYPS